MNENKNFFRTSAEDFKKIPGRPVAYWLGETFIKAFVDCPPVGREMITREGMATSNNDLFMRFWPEVAHARIAFETEPAGTPDGKWVPYNKGGEFRKWFGNDYYVVNWENDGYAIKHSIDETTGRIRSHNYNGSYGFRPGLTWSAISSGTFSVRKTDRGYLFDSKGAKGFVDDIDFYAALLNCKATTKFLEVLAPTLDFKVGDIIEIPVAVNADKESAREIARECVRISQQSWNSFETAWRFGQNELVSVGECECAKAYEKLRKGWTMLCEKMRRLEEQNNRIFIDAYGLGRELDVKVPWQEITLDCNPWYRYGKVAPIVEGRTEIPTDPELEARLKTDTVKELVSYAVGCMMGRYSLEKPGLILADQASTIADYWEKLEKLGIKDEGLGIGDELGMRNEELGIGGGCEFERRKGEPHSSSLIPHSSSALIPNPSSHIPHSFSPDDDGIIPVLDNDWFADDIVTRFKAFVKAAFGEKHFFENMAWIEEALGKDIRSYFTKDFYKDHLQRYQNRPIYWLFQSPKGAFRALIYMHRYRPDTVGGVLGYLRSLQTKIDNQLDVAMRIGADESKSASERVQANKDVVKYARAKKELDEYEKNVLYPLSTERIEIDLDDGVKVNYRKFGAALAKVKALEGKGE